MSLIQSAFNDHMPPPNGYKVETITNDEQGTAVSYIEVPDLAALLALFSAFTAREEFIVIPKCTCWPGAETHNGPCIEIYDDYRE